MKKEIFLGNKTNKQRFINLLGKHLEDHGKEVVHAEADADVLILLGMILTSLCYSAASQSQLLVTFTFDQN